MAKEKGVQTGRQVHHSEEERLRLGKQICDLYETQGATLASCCAAVGITDRTFYFWLKQNSELSEIYEKTKASADKVYWDLIRQKAQVGLEKLITGYKVKESKREHGENDKGPFTKEIDTTTEVGPNATAVIFALKGIYPEMFTERQKVEHTGGIATINPDKLTAEQKRALLALVEKAS